MEAGLWLSSAWWLQLDIRLEVNPRCSLRGIYSNQRYRCCLQGQWQKGLSASNWKKVVIDDDEEKFFQVGAQLPPRKRQQLMNFLRKNIDIFVWSTYNALGVDPDFICHHLNVNPSAISKKQPPRCSSREHSNAIKGEVLKLK